MILILYLYWGCERRQVFLGQITNYLLTAIFWPCVIYFLDSWFFTPVYVILLLLSIGIHVKERNSYFRLAAPERAPSWGRPGRNARPVWGHRLPLQLLPWRHRMMTKATRHWYCLLCSLLIVVLWYSQAHPRVVLVCDRYSSRSTRFTAFADRSPSAVASSACCTSSSHGTVACSFNNGQVKRLKRERGHAQVHRQQRQLVVLGL